MCRLSLLYTVVKPMLVCPLFHIALFSLGSRGDDWAKDVEKFIVFWIFFSARIYFRRLFTRMWKIPLNPKKRSQSALWSCYKSLTVFFFYFRTRSVLNNKNIPDTSPIDSTKNKLAPFFFFLKIEMHICFFSCNYFSQDGFENGASRSSFQGESSFVDNYDILLALTSISSFFSLCAQIDISGGSAWRELFQESYVSYISSCTLRAIVSFHHFCFLLRCLVLQCHASKW